MSTDQEPGERACSASQVETFELCARKHAWSHLDGIKREKGTRELGKQVHDILARWLSEGAPIPVGTLEGQIAMTGIHLLPPPRTPGVEVEGIFGLRIEGQLFMGYKDVQLLSRSPPLVGDHKTTKDYRYAKLADELHLDVQACLYAADAMIRTRSEECDLVWIYYSTLRIRPPHVVLRRVTRGDIEPRLARAVQTAKRISLIRAAGVTAIQVPPNPHACEAYGGCEYKDLCGEMNMAGTPSLEDWLSDLEGKPSEAPRSQPINPPPSAASIAASATMAVPAPMMPIPPVIDPALARAEAATVAPPAVTAKRGRKPAATVAPPAVTAKRGRKPAATVAPPELLEFPTLPIAAPSVAAVGRTMPSPVGEARLGIGDLMRSIAAALRAAAGAFEAHAGDAA